MKKSVRAFQFASMCAVVALLSAGALRATTATATTKASSAEAPKIPQCWVESGHVNEDGDGAFVVELDGADRKILDSMVFFQRSSVWVLKDASRVELILNFKTFSYPELTRSEKVSLANRELASLSEKIPRLKFRGCLWNKQFYQDLLTSARDKARSCSANLVARFKARVGR